MWGRKSEKGLAALFFPLPLSLMSPPSVLRLEGALVLFAAVVGYAFLGTSWWLFLVLLLVPDGFMVGYLAGPRLGALIYNLGHTYAVPMGLGAAAVSLEHALIGAPALIWAAHVGMDRALGYGLKYPSGFHDTHLRSPGSERDRQGDRQRGPSADVEMKPARL